MIIQEQQNRAGISCPVFKDILLIFLLFPIFIFSQESEEKMYQIFQKENSDTLIVDFFKKTHIQFKSDTVYVLLLPPMGCPRCESVINPIISFLKRYDPNKDILIVAIYNKYKAARQYLKRRQFKSDYNIIASDQFLNSFILSVEPLLVPFLTKFNIKTGLLINSESLLGFTADSSNVLKFVKSEYFPKRLYSEISKETKYKKTDTLRTQYLKESDFNVIKRLKLNDSEEFPLSKIINFTISPSGRYLSILDDLSLNIHIYDLQTGKFINIIYPDSVEEKTFIKVSEPIYQYMKQNNIINSMYLNNSFYNDTILVITASLPKVVMEGENIGYYNEAVLILKNINKNQSHTITTFSQLPDTNFVLSHTVAQFIYGDSLIYIPITKGWPAKGTTIIHNISRSENPFDNDFYNFAPQCAVYNLKGKFIKYVGKLDKGIENLKLGYIANTPIIKKFNNSYWMTDRISGMIHRYDDPMMDNQLYEISVFENDLKPADINFYERPLDYIMETYKRNYKKQIIDFLIYNHMIYSLIKENELFYVAIIDYGTKNITKKYLPKYFEGVELNNFKLGIGENALKLITLLEKQDETYYIEIK